MEHQGLLFKWFQGENECLLGLPTMTTNSFENLFKNLETFLFIIFSFSFALGFILFLEVSTKFMMTKISKTQVHSFHAHADIKQCLHISKVHSRMKIFKTKLPLVNLLS